MSNNKKVMSLAVKPDQHEKLKLASKRKGLSVSAYVGNILDQALKLSPDEDVMVVGKPIDEDIAPVILKVPLSLKDNPEQLQKWMSVQMSGIIKAMTSKKADANDATAV